MKRFRFQLEVALKWRLQRVAAEQARLDQLRASLAQIDLLLRNTNEEWNDAQRSTLNQLNISAEELAALSGFRRAVDHRRLKLDRDRQKTIEDLARQQKVLVEETRQCRLLEKLKDRKHQEWVREADKQLEADATEIYLSQWKRD